MRIVVGGLGTPPGRAAVVRALEETRLRGGELTVVAYVPNPSGADDSRTYPERRRRAERETRQLVDELTAQDGTVPYAVTVPSGPLSPAEAILETASETEAELIVIGLRRRSRVGKLVLGSNAQEILLRADAAVLTVPAPG